MGFRNEGLQGYMFEVIHEEYEIPEDAPRLPGMPEPGTVIEIHKLQFFDPVMSPQGDVVGVRHAVTIELQDRQRDELVRQLQGGAPEDRSTNIVVAGGGALKDLPAPDKIIRGR